MGGSCLQTLYPSKNTSFRVFHLFFYKKIILFFFFFFRLKKGQGLTSQSKISSLRPKPLTATEKPDLIFAQNEDLHSIMTFTFSWWPHFILQKHNFYSFVYNSSVFGCTHLTFSHWKPNCYWILTSKAEKSIWKENFFLFLFPYFTVVCKSARTERNDNLLTGNCFAKSRWNKSLAHTCNSYAHNKQTNLLLRQQKVKLYRFKLTKFNITAINRRQANWFKIIFPFRGLSCKEKRGKKVAIS